MESAMQGKIVRCCVVLLSLGLASYQAKAQEIVHALTGMLTSVNPKTSTLHVATDDGSDGLFKIFTDKGTQLSFQKNVKAESVPAAGFTKTKTQVLVFYIGDDAERTAVALEDLGAGPFVKTVGTVVKLDRHAHILTVKDSTGVEQTFHIDAKTVGEATNGVLEGEKFDADKGAKVRVIASTENGAETALFIRALSF
jgi:hypothetical protein